MDPWDTLMSSLGEQPATPGREPTDVNYRAALEDMKLTPQEQYLYQTHLNNLASGGVLHPDGSRSTLFQMTAGLGDKTYSLPTVYDGKILPPEEAIARAKAIGLDKFPAYGSHGEADARYARLHGYMEKDRYRGQ